MRCHISLRIHGINGYLIAPMLIECSNHILRLEEIICDMLDKNIHEILADKFHSTEDPLVKRQIFITLHNFINGRYLYVDDRFFPNTRFTKVKNSEKIMHPNVIRILIKTIQDEYGDPRT